MNAGIGCGTFEIIDEWQFCKGGEKFRLVKYKAGPHILEKMNPLTNDEYFKPESECFIHSVLCARIAELLDKCAIKDRAIKDALSAFNNEEGETTLVNEERLEAWESAQL